MWVNITDSLLSIILVCVLIPKMGIMGYALVIVIMEGYNFLLSFFRLKRKISFSISPVKSGMIPLIVALISTRISRSFFNFSGSTSPAVWLAFKIIFALCLTIFILAILDAREQIGKQKSTIKAK